MSDGKGPVKGIGEAITSGAKAATVDLAKDIFEQIMGGATNSSEQADTPSATPDLQHQKVIYQAQRNARMAQIQRNISRIRKERELARKEVQEKEDARLQRLQHQKEAAQQAQHEGGFAQKSAGLIKNMSNFIARKGKGEQRGAKIAG